MNPDNLNRMKNVIFWYLVICTAIFECSSQVGMDNSPPFLITAASSFETGGNIIVLTIKISHTTAVSFRKIYYLDRWADLEIDRNGPETVLSARLNLQKKRIIMHSDPREEIGNQPPLINKGSKAEPYLKNYPDEAILLYEFENRPFYYKVSGIRPKAAGIE